MTWAQVRAVGLVFLIGSISAAKVPKVVGGTDAVVKDFPFIVSIRDSEGDHNCGGAIIGERHILTAAHCVDDIDEDNLDNYTIHSGTSKANRIGNVHRIASVHVHPTYESRNEVDGSDDIAVIRLKEPIVFNKRQQKVNLPSQDVQLHQVAYLVGWGRTSRTSWESALQLQKLQVVLLPSEKCKLFLAETKIDEKQVCAFRNTGKSACHGDSGGPLVSHGEIVGVVSRGDTGNCADGTPDIYTNVFAHKDFIESVMNK